MIYLIKDDLAPVVQYLNSREIVGLDIETTGLDCHSCEIYTLQLGDYKDQYVIDTSVVDISCLKSLLESKLIIGHNLKFDIKFLFKKGIYLRKIHDTFVCEKVLNCGLEYIRAGLEYVAERYEGVILNKSIRLNIVKEGLTERVIKYAADDVKYLENIMNAQLAKAEKQGLIGTFNLENRFTPCLAYIEYCGFKLNVDKWKAKMVVDQEKTIALRSELDNYVTTNVTKFVDPQLDMFSSTLKCTVNWDSPKQVVEFFESMGVDCTVVEKGVIGKSVEAGVLQKYVSTNKVVATYLKYKQAEKVVTTYGQTFIDQVNPVTGRIHTNFNQILSTGRISSGGKDRANKVMTINFQNIPSDKLTRSCFEAEDGNILLVSDYSGQEQIMLANFSLDPSLLEFYDKGLADMHSFIASKIYPELEHLSLEEIKSKHKNKRQIAKSAGFAINYGGQGKTIADNLNIPLEEGNYIYEEYFRAFPGLKEYFNNAKKQGLGNGFILINNITRRKSYIPYFDNFLELKDTVDKRKFWDKYRKVKETMEEPEYSEMKSLVRKYFLSKGEIERAALNFPIQGSSADCTKISCVYIYDYIIDNNLFNKVKFVNTIHDENVLEVPKDMAESFSKIVEKYMCKAGDIFCKRVPLVASPEITKFWKK